MSESYDISSLKHGRKCVADNIERIEEALDKERKKLAQYDALINQQEAVLQAHGECPSVIDAGEHDWEVVKVDNITNGWRKRRCKQCPTEQRRGHDSS